MPESDLKLIRGTLDNLVLEAPTFGAQRTPITTIQSAAWLLAVVGALTLTAALDAQERRLPTLETGVVEELNRVRTDPARYAAHLEALLPAFDGKLLRTPHGLLETDEGAGAVREAIRVLRATAPMGPLERSPGMSAAAWDLARDQGATGATGHTGTDGSTTSDRANRYGSWDGGLSENVSYSAYASVDAREVVIQLLVDDGVPGRGHRVNILDPTMRVVGVACGAHARYAVVCVMDHAHAYREGG
jgi:uncharacterized protein YkwD